MDEQGQPLTFMAAVTYKTLEKGQTWASDFERYLESPSIAAKLKAHLKRLFVGRFSRSRPPRSFGPTSRRTSNA